VIGLRDLVVPGPRSWEDAQERFAWPAIDRYNIAADCLRGPRDGAALIVVGADGTQTVTFAELDALSGRLAAGLLGLGVRAGDRIAVKLSQSREMAVTILAILRAGAVVVPVSNVLGQDGALHRLRSSEPRLLVALGTDEERALAAEAGLPLVAAAHGAPEPSLDGLIERAPAGASPTAVTAPDDPALLLYTSGTTGKSKGVLHGHRVLLGHHAIDFALDGVRPDDVAYSPVDWAWAGGLFLGLLVPLAHGLPVVAFREPRFDIERSLELMRACGVSVGLFPPTVLRMLRQSGAVTPAVAAGLRLRCLVTGAEAVEPELFGWAAEELGVTVNNAYGQTEANALVGHSQALGALDPECLGRPYPGRHVAVLDEELRPVRPGEPGQIHVAISDPVCMLEYFGDREATARKIVDGWLPTGDTVHVDDRGQLHFHGRSDDIIKSGGYRIGPAEIEAALLHDPSVAECAVVGLPDPVRGQQVTAFVRLRAAADGDEELTGRLQRQVRETVGAHAYPRAVLYVDDLPRTTTGKVDRATLRRRHGEPAAGGAAR
jgi:acetyl-CoA synthetase